MRKKSKARSAAILTIHDSEDMTPSGRRRLAAWIRRQAFFLEKHAKELSRRFTARYLYVEDHG